MAAKKQSEKKEEWRRVAAQLLKDIREDIALAHHMTGGPRPRPAEAGAGAGRVSCSFPNESGDKL